MVIGLLGILSASADIVISGGLVLVEEGGTVAAGNLATGRTAFAKDEIGVAPHSITNVNDGSFGNASSWIAGTQNSFVGINLGATALAVRSVAFGRDNTGGFTDRTFGLYELQYTTVPNPSASTADANWVSVGTMDYQFAGGANFTDPSRRHVFTLPATVMATGVRLKVNATTAFDLTGVDELELYYPDTTAPVLAAHANVIATATSGAGAVVTYDPATATDDSGLAPTISYSKASGTLFAAGVTTVTNTATDAAGNAATSTFTVTVNPVNNMPSFTKGEDKYIHLGLHYVVNEVLSQSNWATGIDDGESTVTQSLTFNVTNDNNGLFTTQPAVSSTGTLTFTPNGNLGIVTVFVTLTDDNTINGTAALTTAAQAFTITFTDNGGSPVVTVLGGTTAFTEGADAASTPVVVAGTITVTDQDSTRLASATVSIAANFQSGQDVLAFTNDGSTMGDISGSYDPVMGVLDLTSSFPYATIAQWQQALRAVTYVNSSDTPSTSTRTVRFVVRDSGLSAGAGTRSLSVTAANDSPVATVPASIAMTVDVAGALTGISFGDVDAGSGTVGAVFTVGSGTLSATSGSGVTVGGSGTGSLTLAGTITSLNAFIAASSVTFITALNATGNVTLTSAISDNGSTGLGGAKSDSDTTTLTMTVNTARTWLGGGSAWDDDARWSPRQPLNGDSLVFNASGTGGPSAGAQQSSLAAIRLTGDYDGSVVMQAASTTASSLELSATGAAVLDLNGKTLTITGDVIWSSATASIALGGGNLVLLGNLTTSGGGVVNITGAGTVTYSTGVSRTLTLVNAGNAVAGTLVKQGAAPLELAGSGTMLNLGGLSILAGTLSMNGKTLNVAGAPVISGGSLFNGPGSVLNCGGLVVNGGDYQPGGGTLNFNTTGTWSDSGGFENFGSVNIVSGANVTLASDVSCNALNVQGGTANAVGLAGRTLRVNGDVSWSSAATARITGSSGTLAIGGNLTATGAGVIQISSAGAVKFDTAGAKVITLANAGNLIAGGLEIGTGATATSVSFAGAAPDLALGSLTINGTATLNNAANKQISIASSMTQSGTFTAGGGALIFTGTGNLTDNVGTSLGAVTKNTNGVLTLLGTAAPMLFSSLTISAGSINNSGARSTTVSGITTVAGGLNNAGGATFSASGAFTANAGAAITNTAATMNFAGNVTFNAGTGYSGTGNVNFTGTTTLRDDQGVTFGGTVNVSGALTLNAASTQTVAFNALTIQNSASLAVNGRSLQVNAAPAISGTLNNASAAGMLIACGITLSAGGTYVNGGVLRFQGSTGAWTDNAGVNFGRVEFPAGVKVSLATSCTCRELALNGVAQNAGTYGSTASAAANTSDTYFGGTGVVSVVPADISLSASDIRENLPADTTVGAFATTGAGGSGTATFTLVPGTGDTDNVSFTISNGTNLLTAAVFNYELKNSYSLRVRATDSANNNYEKQFTVTVLDLSEATNQISAVTEDAGAQQITLNGNGAGTLTFLLVTGAAHGDVTVTGNIATYTPFNNYQGLDTFSYYVTNAYGTSTVATVTVNVANVSDILPFAFSNAVNYAVGSAPASVVAGKFNKASPLDLIVANYSNATLSVLSGTGTGTFTNAVPPTVSVGNGPVALATANFNSHTNKDTKPDVVVVNKGDNTIQVLLGDGLGGFTNLTPVAVGSSPSAVAVGDLNKDARADVVVANEGDNNITVLLGHGDGGFRTDRTNFTVGTNPVAVAVADFNKDMKADVSTANYGENTVSILWGNGTGFLSNAVHYAVGANPNAVAAGDFNKDGRVDLVVANYGDDTISVLLSVRQTNSGVRTNTFLRTDYPVGIQPSAVIVTNINKDAYQDIIVAGYYENTVQVLLGRTNGAFEYFYNDPSATEPVGTNPIALAMGNFNADTDLDVAVANWGSGNVSILLNNYTPVAYAQKLNVVEDTATPITLTATFGPLNYLLLSGPTNGSFILTNGVMSNATASPVLTYLPTTNANGKDLITFKVQDDGGKTSKVVKVEIVILPVNDAPSFSLASNAIELAEDSPKRSVTNFATDLDRGASGHATEIKQFLYFTVTNDNPGLFLVAPGIIMSGTNKTILTFQPAKNAHGAATVGVRMYDKGMNPATNYSAWATFTLTVTNVNDTPVLFNWPAAFPMVKTNSSTNITFAVWDYDTGTNGLYYSVNWTNTVLFPDAALKGDLADFTSTNFAFGTVGTNRTLTIYPAFGQKGTDKLIVTIYDGTNSVSKTNSVTVK